MFSKSVVGCSGRPAEGGCSVVCTRAPFERFLHFFFFMSYRMLFSPVVLRMQTQMEGTNL